MIIVPARFENAVVRDDALNMTRARPDSLAELPHFGMAATPRSNVLNLAGCFVEIAEREPAFSSSDVQQIMRI